MKLTSMRDLSPVKILILGESGHGKTTSLEKIPDPEGVLYVDLDGKGSTYKSEDEKIKFKVLNMAKATAMLHARRRSQAKLVAERKAQDNKYLKMSPSMFMMNLILEFANAKKEDGTPVLHTIIIDTFSYLMALFELDIKKDEYTNKTNSGKVDGQANWGEYKDFVSETLLDKLSGLDQHVICLNHINKDTGVAEVSGAWKHKTIESMFGHVIRSVKVEGMYFDKLKEDIKNDLLFYNQEDNYYGIKFAYKVLPHPDFETLTERTPRGMFKVEFDPSGESDTPLVNEAFINNDIMLYLNRWYEHSQNATPISELEK